MVKYELHGRHINRGRVEVRKEGEKKGKASRWKRRSRKIKQ
jgi:hypothetical protein